MAALTTYPPENRSNLLTPHHPMTQPTITSSALQRRQANQYARALPLPLSAAGLYDWRINPYHYPVVSGQHNAFPRRIPSAASDKLRQMYLKTDTISGRLAFNSAHERNKQRRWNVLQHTIEEQERELEQRNRDTAANMERLQQRSAPPNVVSAISSKHKQSLIPPVKSWRGMTVIREKRRSRLPTAYQETESLSADDHDDHMTATDKMSAEMSIYLPRADLTEQTYNIRELAPPNSPTSNYLTSVAVTPSNTPRLRYTKRPSTHITRPKNNAGVTEIAVGHRLKGAEQNSVLEPEAPSSSRW